MVPLAAPTSLDTFGPLSAAAEVRATSDDVYAQYFDFVWNAARRFGVPEAALEDVVQDVFVVVHRRLAEFEGRASVKTWLYRIVFCVVRDHRRTARRKGQHEELPEVLPDQRPDPLEVASQSEALRAVEALLSKLSEPLREVFVLAELEGLTAPETAAVAGINLNTVYSRLRAARAAFAAESAQQRERDHG
jgi:RNA polymerase sigma-70 factor (ECF subfamily)